MSFDNIYPKRKDKRKQARGSKRFDHRCKNHGGCSWCEGNRSHSFDVQKQQSVQRLKDYLYGV